MLNKMTRLPVHSHDAHDVMSVIDFSFGINDDAVNDKATTGIRNCRSVKRIAEVARRRFAQ